ncbi:hypothetical protein NLJ89_g3339 [Agrocybe chaxingu]|uniref:Uncharacterized protein n=1 Tax=Agrocybe chaxingu TaxID=84603 RepID=A0A9W8KA14_9AGAR|nr:hypothetical protein NLJ89_g3339 [Agrocybe chaxingu]
MLMSGKEQAMNSQLPPPYPPPEGAPPPQGMPTPQAQGQPMPPQQGQPVMMTPPVQAQPAGTPGTMDPTAVAALGQQYRDQLFAQCAIGNHERTTTYGVCGIITAIASQILEVENDGVLLSPLQCTAPILRRSAHVVASIWRRDEITPPTASYRKEQEGMNDQLPPPYAPIDDTSPPQEMPVPTPAPSQAPPVPQAQAPTPPIPQPQDRPITITPPVQAQPTSTPGSMDPASVAALGRQYRDQLFAQCAIGNHERTTTYGVCGIVTAIVSTSTSKVMGC